jgi:predicted amino acid-binding ACT domain protein
MRCFISDIIQGLEPIEYLTLYEDKPTQIVIATDNRDSSRLVLIGVNTRDRPGLLLDISKGLSRLNLHLHRTEAAVLGEQSVSVWRCSYLEDKETDEEQISVVLSVSVSTPLFGPSLSRTYDHVLISFAGDSRGQQRCGGP